MKKAVIVTGASSGIGRATAIHFADKGHDVVIVGRNKERLKETEDQIKTKCLSLTADLRRGPDCDFVVHESLKVMPHVGILVNNAGVYDFKPFLRSDDSEWTKMIESNLMSTVRLTREILPDFIKKKSGVIVNVASTAGLRPLRNMIPYTTTKAAIIHLTQSLALEHAADQIAFHVVCPGVVETPGINTSKISDMASMHPLGRVGQPVDIAKAIYYLATQAEWMTGVVLPVDGGISLE